MKRLLHWLGSATAVAGVLFVVVRIADYRDQLDISRLESSDWGVIAASTLVYTLANILLAFAWWSLLTGFGVNISRRWAVRVYGVSQIAKYVPGNIFHLAGRQAMGMADNIPAWPLAKSLAWELGLLSCAGAMFAFLAGSFIFPNFHLIWATTTFIVSVILAAIVFRHVLGRYFAHAFSLQVVFLSISGLIFVALMSLVAPLAAINWVNLTGAFVLAWLAGLITPGAPAGLGVRELVLLYLLKGEIQEADLLLTVLLGRTVTVAGDVLFFGAAIKLKRDNIDQRLS